MSREREKNLCVWGKGLEEHARKTRLRLGEDLIEISMVTRGMVLGDISVSPQGGSGGRVARAH